MVGTGMNTSCTYYRILTLFVVMDIREMLGILSGGGISVPRILDLGTKWRWVVSFTPRPLYPGQRAPGTHWIGWVGPRAGLDDVEKRKFLTLPGLELRPICRPARSQSLYRMRYPRDYYVRFKNMWNRHLLHRWRLKRIDKYIRLLIKTYWSWIYIS
jgi:hypothetical protein